MTVSIKWCLNQKSGLELIEPNANMSNSYLRMAEESLSIVNNIEQSRIWTATTTYYIFYYSLYALMLRIGIKCEIHSCSLEFMNQTLKSFYNLTDNKMINDAFKSRIDLQYYVDRPVEKLIIDKTKKYSKDFYIKTKDIIAKITEDQINLIRKELIGLDSCFIIGLTGTHGSGKGEVGKYLVQKGFKYYSCSDELREEAKKLNLPETRENLGIVIGDKLRKEFGKGVLGKRIYNQILKEKVELAVVDSLRLIEEVDELRKSKKFYLIYIDAPIETRYKRALERKRITDDLSLNEFKKIEDKERYGQNTLMKMEDCFKSAQFKLINDKGLNELHKKIDEILKKVM